MAEHSTIEWTDATWNPVTGCSVHSAGCTNCYAMKLTGTRMRNHPSRAGLTINTKAGPVWNGQVRLNKQWLTQPLSWSRPRTIFVCAHADLFHENVPDAWIDQVFAAMALCPQHRFQVLTKRAHRMRDYVARNLTNGCGLDRVIGEEFLEEFNKARRENRDLPAFALPLPNVWLGVSVEDQRAADERIGWLLDTPAAVRFLSCEPLLGPVDLTSCADAAYPGHRISAVTGWGGFHHPRVGSSSSMPRVSWVIVGGESGAGARPMHPAWPRALRDQCHDAQVPFFFKQWGEWAPVSTIGDELEDQLYRARLPRHQPEGPRRCKVAQCVLHADGVRFDMDEWSRTLAPEPWRANAAGTGHMQMMAIGKGRAGRLLDGRTYDGMPA